MFSLSDIQNIKANEITNSKIEKLRTQQESTRRKMEEAERELEQAENKIKRLSNSLSEEERKKRTRRLIERGAIVEAFIPEADTLTNEQLKAFLKSTLTGSYAVAVLAKIRSNAKSSYVPSSE